MAVAARVVMFAFLLLCVVSLGLGMPREAVQPEEKDDLKPASSYGFGYGYYPWGYGGYGYGYGYGYPYIGYYGAYAPYAPYGLYHY